MGFPAGEGDWMMKSSRIYFRGLEKNRPGDHFLGFCSRWFTNGGSSVSNANLLLKPFF